MPGLRLEYGDAKGGTYFIGYDGKTISGGMRR